jgi:hypothetical protein
MDLSSSPSLIEETLSEEPLVAPSLAFTRCVERLARLIDAETRVLKSGERVDFEALNFRKTHALLELTQVSKNASQESFAQAREGIDNLHKLLAANTEALERHLQAMQEITMLIVESIREDESDGTYSVKGMARR